MPLCRPFERSNTERKITAVPNGKRGAERYCICRDYCNRNICSCQRVLSKKCSCCRKNFFKTYRWSRRGFMILENSKQIRCIYTRRRLLAIPSRSFWNSKQIRCGYTSDFCPLPPEGQRANPMSTHLLLSWDSHTLMRRLMPAVIYLYRRFSFRRKRT